MPSSRSSKLQNNEVDDDFANLRARREGAHLRDNRNALVEEFIVEIEGKERDHTKWSSQFADLRQVDSEMLQRVGAAFDKWLSGRKQS